MNRLIKLSYWTCLTGSWYFSDRTIIQFLIWPVEQTDSVQLQKQSLKLYKTNGIWWEEWDRRETVIMVCGRPKIGRCTLVSDLSPIKIHVLQISFNLSQRCWPFSSHPTPLHLLPLSLSVIAFKFFMLHYYITIIRKRDFKQKSASSKIV